jgi:phospholipase/carboxylesterase
MAVFSGTRYPEKLAGIMGLSGYMVLAPKFDSERDNANQTVPVFLAHGTQDPVVPLQLGEDTRQLLEATQYSVEWHTYSMPHSVCQEEVADIAEWLRRVL